MDVVTGGTEIVGRDELEKKSRHCVAECFEVAVFIELRERPLQKIEIAMGKAHSVRPFQIAQPGSAGVPPACCWCWNVAELAGGTPALPGKSLWESIIISGLLLRIVGLGYQFLETLFSTQLLRLNSS